MKRYLFIVKGSGVDKKRVEAYLPSNYTALAQLSDGVLCNGRDSCGWTMEDYVKPRLASGLMWVTVISSTDDPVTF